MDQVKIGKFLKELRINKGLTQEDVANKFYVSSRSVSRWENGVNLPDVSLLIEIADFYEVDVREIIEGEKNNKMNEDNKDVAKKVAAYAKDETERSWSRIIFVSIAAAVLLILSFVFSLLYDETSNANQQAVSYFVLFMGIAFVINNILYSVGLIQKIAKIKWLRILLWTILIIVVLIAILILLTTIAWFTKA